MATSSVVVDFNELTAKDFSTPQAPDLGVFIANRHGFQESGASFYWNEFAPFDATDTGGGFIPHQVYVRLIGGEALFQQRVFCWRSITPEAPFLTGQQPDFLLGGGPAAEPTDWVQFPVQPGGALYWFVGEHRRPGEAAWVRNTGVGHKFDLYKKGTLSTVFWEDAADRDFNDAVMEVAVVFRRTHFRGALPFALTAAQTKAVKRVIAADRRLAASQAPKRAKPEKC